MNIGPTGSPPVPPPAAPAPPPPVAGPRPPGAFGFSGDLGDVPRGGPQGGSGLRPPNPDALGIQNLDMARLELSGLGRMAEVLEEVNAMFSEAASVQQRTQWANALKAFKDALRQARQDVKAAQEQQKAAATGVAVDVGANATGAVIQGFGATRVVSAATAKVRDDHIGAANFDADSRHAHALGMGVSGSASSASGMVNADGSLKSAEERAAGQKAQAAAQAENSLASANEDAYRRLAAAMDKAIATFEALLSAAFQTGQAAVQRA